MDHFMKSVHRDRKKEETKEDYEKKAYAYWLWCVEGMGGVAVKRLFEEGLCPQDIYRLSREEIEACAFLKKRQKEQLYLAQKRDPFREYEWFLGRGIHFVSAEDADYPSYLRNIYDAPFGLFYLGHLPEENKMRVAIVGARNCSSYGKEMACNIAKKLSDRGVIVISGMARGIDGYAHRGALSGKGESFAVLGCGVDVCYPQENREIYEEMKIRGGIMSEFPPGMAAVAKHFPQRNRIISGLSDAVLVVEAKAKSGSLITVDYALEQGREVFALPGPVDSYLSKGCHNLMKQGAAVFTDVDDFLEDLMLLQLFQKEMPKIGRNPEESPKSESEEKLQKAGILCLENEEAIVYSEINLRPKTAENIAEITHFPVGKVRGILVALLMKGFITEVGKGQYVVKH